MDHLEPTRRTPRPSTLKRINMRRFLEEIRLHGPRTRADLGRAIGVTPPTSSSIIADLISQGLLEESPSIAGAKGRPGKLVGLASSAAYVVGVAIDVTECRLSVAGLDGELRPETSVRLPTPDSYDGLIALIQGQIRTMSEDAPGRCLGVGIAVPGLVDETKGVVALSPNLHFLDGRPLANDLSSAVDTEVVCTQEEHALCLCEQHRGRARGLTDFAVMDFSSGVGMGVVCNGAYVSGSRGFAGEIGHITVDPDGLLCGCGNRGCLETVASDTALLRQVGSAVKSSVTFDDLRHLDVSVQLNIVLDFIAIGVATVVNIFNPSAVFVHGSLFHLHERVLGDLDRRVRARTLRPSADEMSLHLAHGDKLLGAVAALLDRIFSTVGPKLH